MPVVNPDVSPPALSRRQRVHRSTKSDLVDAARQLLVEEGLTSITVRAVASQLGMTAPAIYRYYDSRERLLDDVVDVLYDELADVLETACESQRNGTVTDRFLVTAHEFRRWALAHRAEFGLLFGAPVPGVAPKGHSMEGLDSVDAEAARGLRFMLVWLRLFLEIPTGGLELPRWPRPISLDLRHQLLAYVQRLRHAGFPLGLPDDRMVELAMLFLTSWQELYGFICTETFGHLSFALDDCADLFADRLEDFRQRLNLP